MPFIGGGEMEYVSREALLKALRMSIDCKDCPRNVDRRTYYDECACSEVADICNVITDFPKADVREVKHGKWIENHDWIRCDICGFEIKDEYYEKRLQYKGCPNCLSVMDIK